MSTKPNTNLKAIELTQAELDSVAGGGRLKFSDLFVIQKIRA